ncbi:hypothetical protein PGB90_003789 [Kerria lacca]
MSSSDQTKLLYISRYFLPKHVNNAPIFTFFPLVELSVASRKNSNACFHLGQSAGFSSSAGARNPSIFILYGSASF